MSVFSRLRLYHAAVALLAVAAYLTEDAEELHVWLGYALAGIISTRLIFTLLAPRFLSKPHWLINWRDLTFEKGLNSPIIGKGILVAIMACLFVTIGTGIVMDRKLTQKVGSGIGVSTAFAGDKRSERKRNKPDKAVKEIHEAAANSLFLFVFLHIAYLLLIRRQYALSMMFLGSLSRRL